jgi:sulfite oxidase
MMRTRNLNWKSKSLLALCYFVPTDMFYLCPLFSVNITLLISLLASTSHAQDLLIRHNSEPLQAESSVNALIPWETPISGFFIRSHFSTPAVDEDNWRLVVDGLVTTPLNLTLADLKKLPSVSLHAVLTCSGNGRSLQAPRVPGIQWQKGAVGNAEWTGVPLNAVLGLAGVRSNAAFVSVAGADTGPLPETPRFVRSIPLSKAMAQDTILAWKMNRESLPPAHGGPVRIILPGWYGESWVKWVNHLSLSDREDKGFFMKKAYRMPRKPVGPGAPWDSATGYPVEQMLVHSFITSPKSGETLKAGGFTVSGKAFSGAGAITKVEVSTDGGKVWHRAQLEPSRSLRAWQEFSLNTVVSRAGDLEILARATDRDGNRQPLKHTWNPNGYLNNSADRVKVKIGADFVNSGEDLLHSKCLTCHELEIINSQRLTLPQWTKTIHKMKIYGAKIEPAEEFALAEFLSQNAQFVLPRIDYNKVTPVRVADRGGSVKNGEAIFNGHCAPCHGSSGLGLLGPRIRGRMFDFEDFNLTVIHGKRTMPSFNQKLTPAERQDVFAFLKHPLKISEKPLQVQRSD